MRIFMAVAMVAVVSVTVGQSLMQAGEFGVTYTSLCKTYYFILPNTVNQIVNIVFVFVGFKISKSIREFNKGQLSLIEDEPDVAVQGQKQEIEARKKSMCQLWLIIITISFDVTYQSLNSLILFFYGDENECFIIYEIYARSAFTVFARLLQYVFWYYPILWLFWPPTPQMCRRSNKFES